MKIFVAGKIPEEGLKALAPFEVEIYNGEGLITERILCEKVKETDAILSLLSTPITRKVIESAPNLKIISNFGAGFNNIDCEAAREKGVIVTNTPLVSTDATAELTMGILLDVSRRISEGDRLCRTTGFEGWAPLFFLGDELKGKTIGIIGFGNIGQAVAKRASAFDMNILYFQRNKVNSEVEKATKAAYCSFDELIKDADYVVLNCSYNESMKHMINKEILKKMKPSGYLINAARGPLVNEKDLIEALEKNEIKGAALDVFEFEPLISEALMKMNNVVLTPHIGNATIETRNEMSMLAAKNISLLLEGQRPLTPV